ncbi:MAG TPA: MBL fold metallo-hydrolase [Candidatus Mediterraneibacter quadrami]|uniref:MBL fold metallo-hydrolase n=1 Tax=Candidatus Mediterraneibacter quadrami TaxID=2838684 RepID=A0A9D2U759_9FIRM|nr:MBL fold metallo-hydrolase [Candidatus Mediterraneibacter quadrami]
MKIENFVLGPVGTNCYIVSNEETKECFLVDMAACPPELVSHIKNSGLMVKAVLLTHGHFDHIMGLDRFLEEFPAPVYACAAEKELLESAQLNSSSGMLGQPYTFHGAQYVKDGDLLEIAGMKIQVIQTPGHTIGGCCYYIADEQTLFSGDTLFRASIGRTDLPTGSMSALVRSVTEKILVLPDETRVYPGHMEETTVGYEKKYNPFL